MTKPILKHNHPASLVPLQKQITPSRGWGEDFSVRITEQSGESFCAVVDIPLLEVRLHGLDEGDEIVFHEDHILAVHDIHRQELVAGMDGADLKELTQWLASLRGSS